jgi:hypothetical protein
MFLATLSPARRILVLALSLAATAALLGLALIAAALAFGGPTPPPTMHSIGDPFKA